MAIYDPQLKLSKAEIRALKILDALLVRAGKARGSANSGEDHIDVSASEARSIANFLEELQTSRKFLEAAYFCGILAAGRGLTDDRAKEIYLSWRRRYGKTRVASTFAWNEFVLRSGFGFSDKARMYPRAYRGAVVPMPLPHFLAMEMKLSRSYGMSPRATHIIARFYEKRLRLIDEVRKGSKSLPPKEIENSAAEMAETFKSVAKCAPAKSISKRRLAACSGLIMDVGAIFITRDWTATGVLSAVGMTFPDAVGVE